MNLTVIPNSRERLVFLACQAAGRPVRKNILYVDRSRIVAREECPQRREYEYETLMSEDQPVPGIQLKARSVPLCTGIAVHEGLAELAAIGNTGPCTDTAVKKALDIYNKTVADRGFFQGVSANSGSVQWIIKEQTALVEALVNVGALRIIPQILNSGHQIISIEKERVTWIGEDEDLDLTILLLSRADLEMYDPISHQLYVINYKTQKTWDDRDQDRLSVNMQTLGEPAALKAAFEARHLFPEFKNLPTEDLITVAGVQYIILLKGEQRMDQSKGHEVTYSHLTRAWTSVDPLTGKQVFSWRYFHEGSKRQVLSKGTGFHPFESYPGGTTKWVQDLASQQITGGENAGDPLSECIVMPAMCYAHPEKLDRWQSQTVRDEIRWWKDQQELRPPSMITSSCGTGRWRCQFWFLCHEKQDPVHSGLYQPRDANHETEN